MKKIIGSIFIVLFVVLAGSLLMISYNNLKPQRQLAKAVQPHQVSLYSEEIDFKNLESTLLNEDGTYYLWFCDSSDDCNYVENEYIVPMLNTLNIDSFENLHKINFTECPYSKQRLLETYNVDSSLAFVKVEVIDGVIEYSNSLTWTAEKTFSFDDLQQWLYDQNIWQTSYESTLRKTNWISFINLTK